MKRYLACILVLAMLLACLLTFASCNGGEDTTSTGGTTASNGANNNSNNNNNNNNNSSNNNLNGGATQIIENDLSKLNVTYATPFSEGKAFVHDGDNESRLHCIDRTGKILFTVTHPNAGGYLYVAEGFHNGIAALNLYLEAGGAWLCNDKGELIEPSSVGATAFCIEETESFGKDLLKAGYILARKTTTTFEGSIDEFAIFNSELELLVDFSADLDSLGTNYNYVYKNYVFDMVTGKYIRLEDGSEGLIKTLLDNTNLLYHPSDAWSPSFSAGSWDGYFNLVGESMAIDLSEYSETLYHCGEFKDAKAPLLFRSDSTDGQKQFFTILNEDGEFEFDPIEIYAGYEIKYYADNTYILYAQQSDSKHKIASIDFKGNLKEIELESTGNFFQVRVQFSDQCVMFKDNGKVKYFDLSLESIL